MRKFADRIFSPRSGGSCSSSSTRRKMASSSGSSGGGPAKKLHGGTVNDLQHQKSPYLLQHKTNPVEWHPWSPATHQLAVQRAVPIFLSIGYSTCHWCHVMERESFENPQIAAVMNENFVNIKIDREEHPDIDRIYMSFVTAVSGSGGWPLSVWLTPSLRPIYGGTYYPPENRYFGRPGFKSLLESISEQWEENRAKCEDSAANIFKLLEKNATLAAGAELPNGLAAFDKCVAQLRRSYEPSFGGFSESPKFPQPGNFTCLIDYCGKQKKTGQDASSYQKMVERTLLMMAQGGIHDHIGKGFARYSTDKKWHVPHFEKMLYDQAQLVEAYAHTYKLNGDEFYSLVTQDIVEYVMRDLSHPEGGFYSAEDADSENKDGLKREGAFYVVTSEEIDEILADQKHDKLGTALVADVFKFRFGVKEKGNVDPYQDPHDELKNQNVLFEANSIANCAKKFKITEAEVETVLNGAKAKLFEWRNLNRKRPGLDDKIIASWNGLMITALSNAAQALDNDSYLDRAVQAMRFCKKYLMTEDCDLYRTCYAEENGVGNLAEPIHGCVDDFANLVSACLGLFQASGGEMEWIELARKLQAKQDALYWDAERGGYFNSRQDPTVLIRMKDDDDGAEPSSNSTSLRNLLQFSQIDTVLLTPASSPAESSYSTKIPKLIKQFTDRIEKIPIALPIMTSLVHSYTENLVTTLVFDGNNTSLRKQIGKQVMLPYGSAIVPVKNPSQVSKEYFVPGRIVKLVGQERTKEVVDSVENCM